MFRVFISIRSSEANKTTNDNITQPKSEITLEK